VAALGLAAAINGEAINCQRPKIMKASNQPGGGESRLYQLSGISSAEMRKSMLASANG